MQQGLGSNPGPNTSYPEVFMFFPVPPRKFWKTTSQPQPLHSPSFPVHQPSITLSFDTTLTKADSVIK